MYGDDMYDNKVKVTAAKSSGAYQGARAYGGRDYQAAAFKQFNRPHYHKAPVVHKKQQAPAKDVFGGMRSRFGGVGRRFDGDVRGSYNIADFDNALAW